MLASVGQEQLAQLSKNIMQLGVKRLSALVAIGVFVFAAIGIGAYYLSRPATEVLYTGLASHDIGRITAVLEEAGVYFDVNSQGNAILVPYGQTARARMLLARQGLPNSSSAGYELFDQLGSMGLTSFMQEVTRVRALEGEIARTIQSMSGVLAARVHLVMPDPGSFRRKHRPPSASVVIRTESGHGEFSATPAIRHIVAAAVPEMKVESVSVLNSDGTVLAAAGNSSSLVSHNMFQLESEISRKLQERASRTLAPYLGLGNYQISIALRLNLDKKHISEQTFDPKSRVERSVRIVKQAGSTENKTSDRSVGVEQNIPEEEGGTNTGDQSKQQEERREELTNYELSSRNVKIVSEGYRIDHLAIAVTVNRERIMETLGAGASKEALTKRLQELKQIIAAATGLDTERGDQLEISAVDFQGVGNLLEPVPQLGIVDQLLRNVGTIINAAALLILAFLAIWFGLRPAVNVLAGITPAQAIDGGNLSNGDRGADDDMQQALATAESNRLEGAGRNTLPTSKERLQEIIETNEEQVIDTLKQWIRKTHSS